MEWRHWLGTASLGPEMYAIGMVLFKGFDFTPVVLTPCPATPWRAPGRFSTDRPAPRFGFRGEMIDSSDDPPTPVDTPIPEVLGHGLTTDLAYFGCRNL